MSEINFGITKETRSEGTLLFNPPSKLEKSTIQFPNGYSFPLATLVNVVADPKKETKEGERAVLMFIFKGKNGEQHTHIEWQIDKDDPKFMDRLSGMQSRIKHILEQVGLTFPEEGIGAKAASFEELFKDTADFFNSQTKEVNEKPVKIYSQSRLYIKLTYYKANLNFPMFPNFIQTAEDKEGKAKVCKLTIDVRYDNLEPTKPESNIPNLGSASGGADIGDLPVFQ